MSVSATGSAALFRTAGLAAILSLTSLLPAAAQTHVYTLNNTYADANGGPSLTPDGGTLSSAGYAFGKDQGLTLNSGINATNYSVDLTFSLTDLGGYRKLVDFGNLGPDTGLYLLNGQLDFYNVTGAVGPVVAANQSVEVLLTRDGVTGQVTGSVNGVQQFSFLDTGNIAVFNAPNSVIHFFEDDAATGGNEASGGTVTRIVLNGAAVPEASTPLSLGLLLGLGGAALLARRRAGRFATGAKAG